MCILQHLAHFVMARHLISPAWLEELHTDDVDDDEALHLREPSKLVHA